VAILLMAIDGSFINGYWWLFYQCLLVGIILMAIGHPSINGYWWVLVTILLMAIGGHW
jgi:hypothetical protein